MPNCPCFPISSNRPTSICPPVPPSRAMVRNLGFIARADAWPVPQSNHSFRSAECPNTFRNVETPIDKSSTTNLVPSKSPNITGLNYTRLPYRPRY
uniref:Uncharacterized protein n=1 Tax=Heterorhabditis bacteriophora TaxID=37862 RepID=A0A1I7WFT7_HETBA